MTQVAHKLMVALGYKEYGTLLSNSSSGSTNLFISLTVTHGGDWGGLVSRMLQVDLTYR